MHRSIRRPIRMTTTIWTTATIRSRRDSKLPKPKRRPRRPSMARRKPRPPMRSSRRKTAPTFPRTRTASFVASGLTVVRGAPCYAYDAKPGRSVASGCRRAIPASPASSRSRRASASSTNMSWASPAPIFSSASAHRRAGRAMAAPSPTACSARSTSSPPAARSIEAR